MFGMNYHTFMIIDTSRMEREFPFSFCRWSSCGISTMRRREARAQFRFPNDGHWRGPRV